MVVVDEAYTGSLGLDEVVLRWCSHLVCPVSQTCLLADVFKDDGAGLHKAARGNWPAICVKDNGVWRAGVLSRRKSGRGCDLCVHKCSDSGRKQAQDSGGAMR